MDALPVTSIHTAVGLMTNEEMSGVLQVSPQTLATWRCKKRGPPSIKLGKKVFYLIADFHNWTQSEAKRQRATKPPKPIYTAASYASGARIHDDF